MKEFEVEIILWDWLKTKSEYIKEIYFNRKNKLNCKIFKVKGLQEKPDFILEINKGYGKEYYAVEVKNSDKSINIIGGGKILDLYFKNYVEHKTIYYIDDKEIKIDGFVIASQNSLKGYLFDDEKIRDNLKEIQYESKLKVAKDYKIIPTKEGNRTYEFVRILWNIYGRIKKEYEQKIAIGILIADIDNNFCPHFMITHYSENKKRWSQRWWKL